MEHENPHTIETSGIDSPPEAPEVARRIQMPLSHGIGVAMLTIIVLLAAFGVFGESWGTARGQSSSLVISMEYRPGSATSRSTRCGSS